MYRSMNSQLQKCYKADEIDLESRKHPLTTTYDFDEETSQAYMTDEKGTILSSYDVSFLNKSTKIKYTKVDYTNHQKAIRYTGDETNNELGILRNESSIRKLENGSLVHIGNWIVVNDEGIFCYDQESFEDLFKVI